MVEDNADDVELLLTAARTALEAVSFHVVPNGEQAMAYLKGEGQFADRRAHPLPGVILLDLGLPGMNGLDLLAWIRGHSELRTLQVFVWTDSGDRATLERATRAGANRFIPKSVAFVRGGLAGLVRGISQAVPASAEQNVLSLSKP